MAFRSRPSLRRAATASAVIAIGVLTSSCGGDEPPRGTDLVAEGRELYGSTCAACHGTDLRGTATGPPFLDPIYAPNHHSDAAFYGAVENGVEPHHWSFGAMPPQAHLSREEVEAIIAYVRSEQRAEGITSDPSH